MTTIKPATEWASDPNVSDELLVHWIQRIQRDALQAAAEVCRNELCRRQAQDKWPFDIAGLTSLSRCVHTIESLIPTDKEA